MKKKQSCKALLAIAAVLLMGSPVLAANILWVTDDTGPENDGGWTDLLTGNGHSVTRRSDLQALDAGKISDLNAADLVIVSRNTNSGAYGDGDTDDWNGVTSPLMLMGAHLLRSSRWDWMDSTVTEPSAAPVPPDGDIFAANPNDPIFSGIALGGANDFTIVASDAVLLLGVQADGSGMVGNGTMVADDTNFNVWIARWDAGTPYYAGSTQTPAAARLWFGGGADGGVDTDPDGTENFTADGELAFLNAVDDMAVSTNADFDSDNDVDGADFLIWQRGYLNGTTLAEGDANDDGVVNGIDRGIWENKFDTVTPAVTSVPEPATLLLAMGGMAGILGLRRRIRTSGLHHA